ncbi:hypothetical protein SUGI_0507260 [Cryptomeria japonica]|nr:hypothetical protein SUGI_0507260 [Cryptomeria japonica]
MSSRSGEDKGLINYFETSFSAEEEDLIIRLHSLLGNRWALIAGRVPDRTDKQIKSYWYTTLRKKLGVKRLIRPKTHKFASFPMKHFSGENRGRSVSKSFNGDEKNMEGETEVQSSIFGAATAQQNERYKLCKSTKAGSTVDTKLTRKELRVRCEIMPRCNIEIEDSWSGTVG